jgi:hypothetical protein
MLGYPAKVGTRNPDGGRKTRIRIVLGQFWVGRQGIDQNQRGWYTSHLLEVRPGTHQALVLIDGVEPDMPEGQAGRSQGPPGA